VFLAYTFWHETMAGTFTRFSLFLACRKYLLRSLYSDLRSLSSTATPGTPGPSHLSRPPSPFDTQFNLHRAEPSNSGVELDSLPLPATHTPKSSKFLAEDATFLHTAVSRIIFSWCFAESCMMFCLLMLQGLGMFSARCVPLVARAPGNSSILPKVRDF